MSFDFSFKLPDGSKGTPVQWLECWSALYPQMYDEPAYNYLVKKASSMTERDLQILGAWKDGALKKPDYAQESGFDPNKVSFNGRWSPNAASVAFRIWVQVAQELGGRITAEFPPDVTEFLNDWSQRPDKSGARIKRFGLSRATTLLHFVSGGHYPIFDSRVRRAVKKLTAVTPANTVAWYVDEFCRMFGELAEQCEVVSEPRRVDKALFTYGGKD